MTTKEDQQKPSSPRSPSRPRARNRLGVGNIEEGDEQAAGTDGP
jgi:hypothetical protein